MKKLSKQKISFARKAIKMAYKRKHIASYLGITLPELATIAPYKKYNPYKN